MNKIVYLNRNLKSAKNLKVIKTFSHWNFHSVNHASNKDWVISNYKWKSKSIGHNLGSQKKKSCNEDLKIPIIHTTYEQKQYYNFWACWLIYCKVKFKK